MMMFPKGPPFFMLNHRKRADDLEREKASLKEKLQQVHRDLQILVEWQTANLVLHGMFNFQVIMHVLQKPLLKCQVPLIAFAEFAWDHYVSIPDKAELKLYDIFDCMWNLRVHFQLTKFVVVCQSLTYITGDTVLHQKEV